MRTYLSTLFGVCIISAVIRTISPEGAMKKYIEILCSICVLSAITAPAVSYISKLDSIDELFKFEWEYESADYDEIYNGYLLEANTAEACRVLEEELSALLGTDEGSIRISLAVSYSDGEVSVSSATVTLGAKAVAADPDQIKGYIAERVGCECQIVYDIKDE